VRSSLSRGGVNKKGGEIEDVLDEMPLLLFNARLQGALFDI
jgi:hypothetical protein